MTAAASATSVRSPLARCSLLPHTASRAARPCLAAMASYQYYYRPAWGNEAKYAAWKRDVLLFKSIALCNLAVIYLKPYYDAQWATAPDLVSLAMIVSGYYVSIAATSALGINGTCAFLPRI